MCDKQEIKMRIAYISLHWPRTLETGVGKKIDQQIRCWKEAGHEVSFFMHSHPFQGCLTSLPTEVFVYQLRSAMVGKIQTEISRCIALWNLYKAVIAFQPNIIYLRSGMFVYPLHKLFSIAPVVIEINTRDVSEHSRLGNLYYRYNRFTRGITFSRASGLEYMTKELVSLPEFSQFSKPFQVIANGIDISSIKYFSPPTNQRPHLVFIGTPGYPWHGVDKLIDLARLFPDLFIHVIGYNSSDNKLKKLPNLFFHGYLSLRNYIQKLALADVAIGTIALHRKNMEEACPLKVREYLAHGIPVILPYKDTDLDDLECDFLLKIPNREDNILTHGKTIRDFSYKMLGKRVHREIIAPRIDAKLKEAKRLAFFEEILDT